MKSVPFERCSFTAASLASPAAVLNPRVLLTERVPSFAVRLSGVLCDDRIASEDIHTGCNNFHMGRVHADRLSTEMVNGHTNGNRPNKQLVGEAVTGNSLASSPSKAEVRIARLLRSALPRPTLIRAALVNQLPKAGVRWLAGATGPHWGWALSEAFVASPAGVVHRAYATLKQWFLATYQATLHAEPRQLKVLLCPS